MPWWQCSRDIWIKLHGHWGHFSACCMWQKRVRKLETHRVLHCLDTTYCKEFFLQILLGGHNFCLVKEHQCINSLYSASPSTDINAMSLFKECTCCISQFDKVYFTQGSCASDATMQSMSNLFCFVNVSKNWVLEAKHIKCWMPSKNIDIVM